MRLQRWSARLFETLYARLVFALAIIALVPLGAVGLGGAALERMAIGEQSARELTGLARGLAGQIDVYLDPGTAADMRAIAVLPDITSMDPGQQDQVLKALYLQYSQIARLGVFDLAGRRLAASHADAAHSVAELVSFQTAVRQGRQAWEVGPALASGRSSLIIFTPIRDSQRHVVGMLGGVIDLRTLAAVVARVPVGDGGRAFIVDATGRVIVSPDPTLGEDTWPIGQPGAGTVRYTRDGEPWIAGYALVPATGWTVVAERPEAQVLAPAERSWRLALATLGVTAVVVIVAAMWLARRLAAPLGQLAEAARAFGSGGPDFPLPRPEAGGEVGALVEAFAAMRQAVTAREEALRDETSTVETLHRIGGALAAELDVEKLAQAITDAATEVSGAELGAFFYNLVDDRGESYTRYTLSGARREALADFPLPDDSNVLAPTFRGEGVVRLDDVRRDPRYGKNARHRGTPPGHLPVVSYLAVPVVSRSGEVMGGLFFGHSQAAVFTERAERLVVGIASQAAIALDNARLYQQAWQAIRARDEFLSVAAHELKTPVTGIKGFAQVLLRRYQRGQVDVDQLDRALQAIDRGTVRLTRLVDDLLDVSRIRTGRLDLDLRPTDVAELVRDVVERYRDQLGETRPIAVEAPAEPTLIVADRDRLDQVFTNVVDNAVKYSNDGDAVRVRLSADDEGVTLSVYDQGIGLPPGTAETIFEPFGRAVNAVERHIPGMGLGLHICRSIVERHGGRIWAESPGIGRGTAFHVRLARNPPVGEENSTEIVESATTAQEPAHRR